ncbi:MAG: hypothetical protein O9310_09160 [Leptospiraceae bacterium]|nr:hypothetical protein [Leptospiraceae bacterium]
MNKKDFNKNKKSLIELTEKLGQDIQFYSKKPKLSKSGEPVRIDWLKKTNQRVKNLISTLAILEQYYDKEKLNS